jgi:hypothetical protein
VRAQILGNLGSELRLVSHDAVTSGSMRKTKAPISCFVVGHNQKVVFGRGDRDTGNLARRLPGGCRLRFPSGSGSEMPAEPAGAAEAIEAANGKSFIRERNC